jgi:triosephosphate isomerase
MNKQRKPLLAGNWKMFHGGLSGMTLAAAMGPIAKRARHVELVIAPPFTALAAAAHECEGTGVAIAAQNLHTESSGAFTGEVSGAMLKESGATWVIVGHSERRQLFGETDKLVTEKTRAAFDAGLLPIVCVGETLAQRERGTTIAIVENQVDAILDVLANADVAAAIAYEPIWAIGTGKTAGPAEAEEVHAAIRRMLAGRSEDLALHTRILYGGSVKASNAKALFAAPNVDGALVGGASLEASSFGAIADAAEACYSETSS